MRGLMLYTLSICTLWHSSSALAWGGRGHAAICEAAAFLVKEKGLHHFLITRPQMMAHLCNIPDIYWRSLPSEVTSLNSPTHYIKPEVVGLKLSEFPEKYSTLEKQFEDQPNKAKPGVKITSIAKEVGSVWWRADQFQRLAIRSGKEIRASKPPKNRSEESDKNLAYNKAVYDFYVSLGLMGHFVGDASQPMHNTADFDAYDVGHGGLHSYFEDEMVGEFDSSLVNQVVKEARTLLSASPKPEFLSASTTIGKMKALSQVSLNELARVIELDPISRKSKVEKVDGGADKRTPAQRKSADSVSAAYAPLILGELARSAALLAQLWDQSYSESGKPNLTAYHSYAYPLTPEFVAPDYF
jgi:hypothetical protein